MDRRSQWSWVAVDVGNSGYALSILVAILPAYLPSLFPDTGIVLSLPFFGSWKSSATAIWGYTISFSVFVTLIISLILGNWADRHQHRKSVFIFFNLLGAIASSALFFAKAWQDHLIIFGIANIGFTGSVVFYNALLPVVAKKKDWDKLSMRAYAWGYLGCSVLLIFHLQLIQHPEWFGLSSREEGIRWSFLTVGIWWLGFVLPSILFIKESQAVGRLGQARLQQLWASLKAIPKTPALFLFLLAYFFYNDGISTVVSMASIFAKDTLQLGDKDIIGTLLLINIGGWPATLAISKLTPKYGPKTVLLLSLGVWAGLTSYAYFISTALDFWILGGFVALVLGTSQALSRSIYTRLIPTGKEAEFFSIYALSGKVSAIMGPLFFATLTDLTNSPRIAIASLTLFFIFGILLVRRVSIDPQEKPS